MHQRIVIKAALIAFVCLASLAGHTNSIDRKRIEIPAGELATALRTLAMQAGVEFFYQTELVKGLRTEGVAGVLSPEEAVTKLLEGTPLTLQVDSSGAMLIARSPSSAAGQHPEKAPPGTTSSSSNHSTETHGGAELQMAQAEADPEADGSTASDKTSKNAEGLSVEEIVVTAQKREERLQDVPAPVTVVDTSVLLSSNQTRLEDYYAKVPGLSLVFAQPGPAPTIAIRGVTTGGAVTSNPTVGIVVDDVSYGSSTSQGGGAYAAELDPGELAQIEVLRGPQGTLYGASNIGGLVKFVTVDPSTDGLAGRLQVGINDVAGGDDPGYNARGAINMPLGDSVAVRASAFTRRDPGYVDNLQTGERDVNVTDTSGGRLSALWRPSNEFSLKLSALLQESDRQGAGSVDLESGLGDLQQDRLFGTGAFRRKTQAYSATVTGDIGRAHWVSATGYSVDENDSNSDLPVFSGLSAALFGVTGAAVTAAGETSKFTQEIRLSMPIGERFDWLLGAFYTNEDVTSREDYWAVDPDTGGTAGALIGGKTPSKFTEYAAFTSLTVKFTDRFDTQFGLRKSKNERDFSAVWEGLLAPVFFGADPAIIPKTQSEDSPLTYLVTPRFKISPVMMVYGRMTSGYRPGGPNQACGVDNIPCQFSADTTNNYEIGLKGSAMEGAVTFDASVYYIDWKDMQNPSRSARNFAYTDNAGRAKSEGVELSVGWRSDAGLSINGWVAWSNAELTERFPFPDASTTRGEQGDQLPYGSPLSGSLSIDKEFPVAAAVGYVGASASYVDDRMDVFGTTLDRITLPSYTQVDLRAGIKLSEWSLDAFVNNVSDERGVLAASIVNFFSPASRYYIQPRTVGLSVSRSF